MGHRYRTPSLRGRRLATYKRQLAEQDERCAVCRRAFADIEDAQDRRRATYDFGIYAPHPIRVAGMDHDHTTGKHRGLLCDMCNRGIGLLGDNVEGLERALAYLRAKGSS